MLTFDQATQEMHANDRAIGHAIRDQFNNGDGSAGELINAYGAGVGDGATQPPNVAAQADFLRRYEIWRMRNAEFVAPIATTLGYAPPAATGTSDAGPAGLFAGSGVPEPAPAPAPAAASPAAQAPVAPPSEAQAAGKKSRKAWSQADVVALTRAVFSTQGPADAGLPTLDQALGAFVASVRSDLTVAQVTEKGVELGLIAAPEAPAPVGISESDKRVIDQRVGAIAPDNLEVADRLAILRYAATSTRDLIKSLAG
jgi:hypothetical protein